VPERTDWGVVTCEHCWENPCRCKARDPALYDADELGLDPESDDER